MARKLTSERQKLRLDAIRLRQELGWSNRRIAAHLTVPEPTTRRWIRHNYKARVRQNTAPLSPNNIYCMDCLDGLRQLPHNSVDMVFADPPYNIGVNYGGTSLDRHEAYFDWCSEWFKAIERILRLGGALYVMHYPEYCAYWLPRLRAIRLTFQRWITWHYHSNVGQSPNNWTRSHRAILYCIKGHTPKTFNGLADPQPYQNPTDKRIQRNLKKRPGVVPYDVWEYDLVKNVSQQKEPTPNQLPEVLLRRIILTSSNEGDLVVDPFVGSGTTTAVAKQEKRQYIGFDINADYVEIAKRRLNGL